MFDKQIPTQIMFRGWRRKRRRIIIKKIITKFNGIPNKTQMMLPQVKNVFMNTSCCSAPAVGVTIIDVLLTMLFTSIPLRQETTAPKRITIVSGNKPILIYNMRQVCGLQCRRIRSMLLRHRPRSIRLKSIVHELV